MNAPPSPVVPTSLPVTVRLADVAPEPVRWLWPARIPLGKVTLLVGDPAVGKSLVALDIAARVSAGLPWPDARDDRNKPGGVVLLAAEDNLADTVLPRLSAAGGDLARITAVTSVKRIAQTPLPFPLWRASLRPTLNHLETVIQQVRDCRLLLIDPITRFLGQVDSPFQTDTRAFMEPLADLAARHRVAVLAVHSARRTATGFVWQRSATSRCTDSARTVWALVEDQDPLAHRSAGRQRPSAKKPKRPPPSPSEAAPQRRLFLPVKSTVADSGAPLACSIVSQSGGTAPNISWQDDAVAVTTRQVLDRRITVVDQTAAAAWLQNLLEESPTPAAEILSQARDNGFDPKSIRRAFTALGCLRARRGSGPKSVWIWALPDDRHRLARFRLDSLTEMDLEHQALINGLMNAVTTMPKEPPAGRKKPRRRPP